MLNNKKCLAGFELVTLQEKTKRPGVALIFQGIFYLQNFGGN